MLKNVPTKFERNREREKDLDRVHKNCMLSEPRFISQTQKKKKVNTRTAIVFERCACIDARDFTSDTREHLMH